MALPIIVDIDAYGSKQRASCLADFAEYRAVRGDVVLLSGFVDMIKDRGWRHHDLALVNEAEPWTDFKLSESEELSKFENEEEGVLARVEGMLVSRAERLGARYPFQLVGQGMSAKLSLVSGEEKPGAIYLALLATTIAHAYEIKVDNLAAKTVEDAFEEIVAHCMRSVGLNVVVVPTYGDAIETKIPELVRPLGLMPLMEKASFSKRAKDAGTDLVGHVPVNDPRHFPCFVFVGQATCGKSDSWRYKAAETDIAGWRKILLMDHDPHAFLAIPHHVDHRYWPQLQQQCRTAIVDRVRMASMAASSTPDGVAIARSVLNVECKADGSFSLVA